jgi:hypothetical protein
MSRASVLFFASFRVVKRWGWIWWTIVVMRRLKVLLSNTEALMEGAQDEHVNFSPHDFVQFQD